jgi:hypothetical protein
VKFGEACTGAAGAAGFERGIFGAGTAFFGVGLAVVGGSGVVVVVVVAGGGLPAILSSRATVEICGVTQAAALAARPVLTVARTHSRRVMPPVRSPSGPPPLGTFGRLSDLVLCEARISDIREAQHLVEAE